MLISPLGELPNQPPPEFFRPDPTLFWELLPDVHRSPPVPWGDVVNSDGLRMRREIGERDARLRVACFGDSCTYGYGVPVGDAWPSVLDSDPALDVINAGVPGYSSYQGALFADMRCPSWKPDVIVVEYGLNDSIPWIQNDRGKVVAFTDVERAPHVRIDALLHRSVLIGWLASLVGVPQSRAMSSSVLDALRVPSGARSQGLAHLSQILKFGYESVPARVPPNEFRSNLLRIADHAPYAIVLLWPRRRLLDPSTPDPMSVERLEPYVTATASTASDRIDFVNLAEPLAASHLTAEQAFVDVVHGTRALSDIVAAAVREKIRNHMHR